MNENIFYCKKYGDREIRQLINLIMSGSRKEVDQFLKEFKHEVFKGDEILRIGTYDCL